MRNTRRIILTTLLLCISAGVYVGSLGVRINGRGDSRDALALARLTALGVDLRLAPKALVGKRLVLWTVQAKRQRGEVIDPRDYFSPYWDGPIPEAVNYEFADLAVLSEADLQRLTSYEGRNAGNCCAACGARIPLVADPLFPAYLAVYLADGSLCILDGLEGNRSGATNAEIARCFEPR